MKDTTGKIITQEEFIKDIGHGTELPAKEHVIKLKLKKDNTRFGVYYLTSFYNGKQITVDSWKRPQLFKEILAFVKECESEDVYDNLKRQLKDYEL